MDDNLKFVDFEKYCATCKCRDLDEHKEPCNSCLSVPARDGTEKPERWEATEG